MMSAKILLKILMISAWLSVAFGSPIGSPQSNQLEQLKSKVESQENRTNIQEKEIQDQENKIESQGEMIKKLEKQNQDTMNDIVMLHPTTCSIIRKNHPLSTSGMYYINPQGISSSAFQVYCDMSSNHSFGVTVIGHDSESRTYVEGYEDAGSYKRKIKYDISMEQIDAIKKQSKNCSQFIKYECFDSILFADGGYGWWVSRQGSQMNYWGEAAVNSGKCACGMTNNCAGGGKCNCDKNDKTAWLEDSGYLADKNTLPVTELRFGDTGHPGYEKGYHTLGELRCWG